MSIRVLIVDDHKLMREGIRRILESVPAIDVVGESDDGRNAVHLARKLQPDVVLMDISMPEMNGIDAIRFISSESTGVRTIALSMHSTRSFVTAVLTAGASGYVLKDAAATELVEAVTAVANGNVYFSPAVAAVIASDYHSRSHLRQPESDSKVLSSRERQVLQLLAEGKHTKEIAHLLNVSVKTVESHRAQVMKKLELRSVAEMVRYAIREGISPLD